MKSTYSFSELIEEMSDEMFRKYQKFRSITFMPKIHTR